MNRKTKMITVNADNIDQHGFFCYMSKPKSPGYCQKRVWLEARFAEGMVIKIIHEIGGRNVGFIEYIPGEYAWRAVHAPGYMVIHCLWVVGKGKGKGYGTRLIKECLEDARRQGKQGVVMVASERIWLVGADIFLQNGFVEVEKAPPFSLLLKRFGDGPDPCFPKDWEARQTRCGEGLTVLRTPQCPYIEDATRKVIDSAGERGIPARVVDFQTAAEVQQSSPSPYGVFGIVLNGQLLSYHYLLPKDFDKQLTNPK